MNGFNEAFIKAAFDKKKLSLITEYAKICYPDSPEVHVSFYPGDGIRMFKNNDAINILCPSELSPIQESNLTRSLAMGDLFDDADNIENTASYVVNTTLPVNGMINKGMNTPDNLKKIVAVTIGKMNDDNGKFELNNTDVENGTNIIGDLLKTDSSNFKNIKNVVDDYLGNDEHSYGYGIDFSKDIDKLKKEINDIKEEDINPEDSISDEDWDDEWEINEDSGVTPNDNFAGGFSAAYDKLQAGGGLQQEAESDEYDEDDAMESCCHGNGDCCTTEEDDYSDDLNTSPDGSDDHNPVLAAESFTLKSAEEFFNEFDEEIDDGDEAVEETERPYDDYLKLHNYDPKTNSVEINGQRINAGKQPSNSKERNRMNKFLRENKYNPKDGTIQTTMQNADGSYIRRPFTMNYRPTRRTNDGTIEGRPSAGTHLRHPKGMYGDEINFGNHDLYSKPQFANRTLNHEVGHGVSRRIQDDIERGVDNAQTRRYLQAKKNAEEHLQNLDDETKNELKNWRHSNSEELYADLYGTQQNPYYKDASPESVERSVRNDQGPATTRYINNVKNTDLSKMRKANNKKIKKDLTRLAKGSSEKIDKYKNMSDEELQKHLDGERSVSMYDSLGITNPYENMSVDDYRKELIQDEQENIDQNELFKKSPNEWRKKYGDYDYRVGEEKDRADAYDEGIKANKYEGKSRGDFVLNPEYNNVDTSYRQPSKAEYKAAERDMNKKRGFDENDERIYAPKKQYSPQLRAAAENKLKPLQDKYDKAINDYEQIANDIAQKNNGSFGDDDDVDKLRNAFDKLSDLGTQINSTPEGRILKYVGPKYKPPKKEEESSGPNDSISSFNNVVRQKPAKESKQDTKTQQEGFLLKKPKKLKAIPIRDLVSYITVELNAIQDSNDQAMLAGYTCSKLEIVDFYINCIDTQDDRYIVPHTRQYLADGQKQLNSLLTKILQIKPINKGNRLWQLTNVTPVI